MKKLMSLLIVIAVGSIQAVALPPNKYNLMIAPGTLTENSVTLLWDKQYGNGKVVYEISLNGNPIPYGSTTKTNSTNISQGRKKTSPTRRQDH